MFIARLHKVLTTPITKSSSQVRFWFSLSLTFAAVYGFLGVQQAFSSEYVVQDDARQHVFWMRRFLEPDLFPNDLIANYYQSISPDGYTKLYQLAAAINIDPLVFSKLLPPILGLVATAYCFGCAVQILPVPTTGFIATLLLNQNLWIKDDISSGTTRAFMYPLFLAFLYYLMKRSLLPVCIAIALQALFYPPSLLISVGILFLRLWRFSKGKLRLSPVRHDYLFFAVGLGIAVLGLLPMFLKPSEFGSTMTGSQARTMLEFSQNGRTSFFLDNPWEFWFFGARSGLLPLEWRDMNDSYFLLMFGIGLFLPFLQRYPVRFPLVKKITGKIFVLLQMVLASVGLFLAAHALLFELYLPNRYTQHSLRIFMALAGAIALTVLLDALFHACKRGNSRVAGLGMPLIKPVLAIGVTILLSVTLIFSPFFFEDFLSVGYVTGTVPSLYEFFQKQPKDILIASLADEGRNLPTFTKRSVLTAREYAIPFHTGYYAQIRQRTIDLIEAQYSPNLELVQNFIQKYGIDFWLLERTAFATSYLAENHRSLNQVWIRQYQPAADIALANLEEGTVPTLAKLTPSCSVFETEKFIVLQADCIVQASPE